MKMNNVFASPFFFFFVICVFLLALEAMVGTTLAAAEGGGPCDIFDGENTVHFPVCYDHLGIRMAWAYRSSDRHLYVVVRCFSPAGHYFGWGLSPARQEGEVMLNSSALVAYRGDNGVPEVHMYKLARQDPSGVVKDSGDLNVVFRAVSANEADPSMMSMRFEIEFDDDDNIDVDVHAATAIWAKGRMTDSKAGVLEAHLPGDNGYLRNLDFENAAIAEGKKKKKNADGSDRISMAFPSDYLGGDGASRGVKNIHGAFGILSYGIIIPLGVIVARHLRPGWEDWFDTHRGMQVVGFILGVIGFSLGLMLGHRSKGEEHKRHRSVGITIIVFTALQVMALIFRPGKEHEWRNCWSLYHHGIGYLVVLLGVIQIFNGFDILHVAVGWKVVYVLILVLILLLEVTLEVAKLYRWYVENQQQPKGPQHMPAGRMPSGVAMEDMAKPTGPRHAYNTQNIAI
ncbi:hypothetical protein CBR_g37443 [Chara braunii]|uniref:Cytochrome b561 domain-containing protein n=1 Tax=Chara braunii TaxID=69332 RepID=A0A388LMS2_CHABU|nr:hypothetical protein CBR_g37443 [Chara braunii]|eukprot:GBG83640.1 hypothetical protein CBR_g37443 [Chara braunii]